MALSPPLLSAFDPEVSAEGSVDPFSLSSTYERLAERIFPFITVRMSRPRFLTAMAAGAVVCEEFRDELAADGRTPPWLVFEWHVVEALFRSGDKVRDEDGGWGTRVPGVRKVRVAVERGHAVGASSYLKTPKTFGYTGIYRRLAYGLDILDDDLRLSDGGYELLSAWEADRGLDGFALDTGPGGKFRRELRAAVSQAMKRGSTCQSRHWSGWDQIAEHFRPDGAKRREAAFLSMRLRRTDLRQNPYDPLATAVRAEMFNELEKRGARVGPDEEPRWFRDLQRRSTQSMRERLEAIDTFEGVCALILEGFDLIRHLSTTTGTVVTPDDFVRHRGVAERIVSRMPRALGRLQERLTTPDVSRQADDLIHRYTGVRDAEALFTAIVTHHQDSQDKKPPEGKRFWFDRDERGVCIRAPYRRTEAPADYDYTHEYRSATASGFLSDLRRIPR